jgi:hypothetical protein
MAAKSKPELRGNSMVQGGCRGVAALRETASENPQTLVRQGV